MSSRQLHDLTQQELVEHAYSILREAMEVWGEAQNRATTNAARTATEMGATEAAVRAAAAAAREAEYQVGRVRVRPAIEAFSGARLQDNRAKAIANLDILHRQQMIGEWPSETNQAVVDEAMNRAAKISKRRFRKNKMKTKTRRRSHKNTKRRRIN